MAKKIVWSPRAAESLEEICHHIAKDSEYYASIFAKKMKVLVKGIPRFPFAGRVVPEFRDENLREKIFQNYRIVYRIKKDVIEVVVISHSARILDIEQP